MDRHTYRKIPAASEKFAEMSLQAGGSYSNLWSSQTGLQELEGGMGELEPLGEMPEAGFEPQTRARSNTWPLPRPDNYVDPADDAGSKKNSNQNLSGKCYVPAWGSHNPRLFRSAHVAVCRARMAPITKQTICQALLSSRT